MPRTLVALALPAFLVLSALAVCQHGYWGIVAPQLASLAGAQVLVDLTIALSLFCVWMWRDARAAGRNPWPWLAVTLVAGSIGALGYLLLRRPPAPR